MSTYHEDRLKRKNGLLPPLPTRKEKKPLNRVSKKKAEEMKEEKEGSDSKLDKWFEDRRREMTGRCALCGSKTEKNNDETYRRSIHHLFDKRKNMFSSVACHPDNWLEVCFWGNSCHTNIHNGTITVELLHDSAEWPILVKKFKSIYPFIAESERKNIHPLFLKELL